MFAIVNNKYWTDYLLMIGNFILTLENNPAATTTDQITLAQDYISKAWSSLYKETIDTEQMQKTFNAFFQQFEDIPEDMQAPDYTSLLSRLKSEKSNLLKLKTRLENISKKPLQLNQGLNHYHVTDLCVELLLQKFEQIKGAGSSQTDLANNLLAELRQANLACIQIIEIIRTKQQAHSLVQNSPSFCQTSPQEVELENLMKTNDLKSSEKANAIIERLKLLQEEINTLVNAADVKPRLGR